jgi:cytochrome c oxidase subunit 3
MSDATATVANEEAHGAHASHAHQEDPKQWLGGMSPFNASFGKIMMWYFLISDTFTFASFLVAYGSLRFLQLESWPLPSKVFESVPGVTESGAPLVFVSIMTFILIISSVTMVRAVQEGFQKNKKGVILWLIPTIVFGFTFLGCQYLEWSHLIHNGMTMTSPWTGTIDGEPFTASLNFGQLFFTITGFHGLHVTVGVILNCVLIYLALDGYFDRVGHYDMVEKIGLYWHFVDLVWVYVFLCFYLL